MKEEKLLKILSEDHKEEWVLALDGVLFAHRTVKHRSTGFSPFKLLYGRDPKLPIDVTLCPDVLENVSDEFNEAYVKHVSEVMLSIRRTTTDSAHSAIQKAQMKQRVDYNKRHTSQVMFKIYSQSETRRSQRRENEFALAWSLYSIRDL